MKFQDRGFMLIKELSRISAICELDPTAGFELTEDNVIKNWKSSVRDQPTEEEINKKYNELKAEFDAQSYARSRSDAYEPISAQLDMIYWDKKNGTKKWEEAIDKIKKDFPKPEKES
ncbi:hypothetical protein [uncultured Mediterranean phage uvMED]|nr:hypothetical protein [uncultured Mediterranean phage uvMED]